MSKIMLGIRGAITIENNDSLEIVKGSEELLSEIIKLNNIASEDIVSIFFSTTKDLNAEYPAVAARNIGLINTALMCTHEMDVPNGLEKCVRILLHVNANQGYNNIKHVYLKGAKSLRPDLID
tara:strand:- start:7468 stop:7836 length:369 start_codon:yes stop_codon:yes gene_type:complete